MAQPRKYASHAERQAAYRETQRQAMASHLAQRGLPPLPVVSTIPGTVRWKQSMSSIHRQLSTINSEMETYHDARSERWQDGEKGDEFRQQLENLRAIIELVTEWSV